MMATTAGGLSKVNMLSGNPMKMPLAMPFCARLRESVEWFSTDRTPT
jgi:hypothetical protein